MGTMGRVIKASPGAKAEEITARAAHSPTSKAPLDHQNHGEPVDGFTKIEPSASRRPPWSLFQ